MRSVNKIDFSVNDFDNYRHPLEGVVGLLPDEYSRAHVWKARYDRIQWRIPDVKKFIRKVIELQDHFANFDRAWLILGVKPEDQDGAIPGIFDRLNIGRDNDDDGEEQRRQNEELKPTRQDLEEFFNDILFQLWPHSKRPVPEKGEGRWVPVFSRASIDELLKATRIVLRAMNKLGGYRNQWWRIGQEMPWLVIKEDEVGAYYAGTSDFLKNLPRSDGMDVDVDDDGRHVASFDAPSVGEVKMSYDYHRNLDAKEDVVAEFTAVDDSETVRYCGAIPLADSDGWSLWTSIAWWASEQDNFSAYWTTRGPGTVPDNLHTDRAPLVKADLAYWYTTVLANPNEAVGRACHRRYYVLELESRELVLPRPDTGEIYDHEYEREVGPCALSRVLFRSQINATPGIPGATHLKLLLNLLEVVADFYGVEIVLFIRPVTPRRGQTTWDWFVRGAPSAWKWFLVEMEPGYIVPVQVDVRQDVHKSWSTEKHGDVEKSRIYPGAASQLLFSRQFPGRPWEGAGYHHRDSQRVKPRNPVTIESRFPWERPDCRAKYLEPPSGRQRERNEGPTTPQKNEPGLSEQERFFFFFAARVDMPIAPFYVSAADLAARRWRRERPRRGTFDPTVIRASDVSQGRHAVDVQHWETPDGRRVSRKAGRMFDNERWRNTKVRAFHAERFGLEGQHRAGFLHGGKPVPDVTNRGDEQDYLDGLGTFHGL